MIRILGATGRLFEAAAVVPTVEQRIIFNGSIERKFDVARTLNENPNGLLFLKRSLNAERYGLFENEVIEYIGNISTEKIKRILSDVLVNGYYDFSNLEYQQEEEMKKIKLDNGLSKPYSSAITFTPSTTATDWS